MKDLIYLEGAEGMEKLASYAVARNLIPFFGAGFSAGAEALNGSVPDLYRSTGIYEKSTH